MCNNIRCTKYGKCVRCMVTACSIILNRENNRVQYTEVGREITIGTNCSIVFLRIARRYRISRESQSLRGPLIKYVCSLILVNLLVLALAFVDIVLIFFVS